MVTLAILLAMQAAPADGGPEVKGIAPVTNPGSWVTPDDYPVRALREEREGTTAFRLTIGKDGLPSDCEITTSSGHADLDARTCELLVARARFSVGRDAAGNPEGGTYSNRIRWVIPDGDDESWADGSGFAIDDVVDSWPRSPRPVPAMDAIDPADHYPAAALAAGEEGRVLMLLDVDAAGRVTDCEVIEGSLSASLDAASCALMRAKGEFVPALDNMGKPTTGVVPVRFSWSLPRSEEAEDSGVSSRPAPKFPMSDPGIMTLTLTVGADGSIGDCRFSGTGSMAPPPAVGSPCEMFEQMAPFIPFRDADGQPVARRVTMRNELVIEAAPEAAKTTKAK